MLHTKIYCKDIMVDFFEVNKVYKLWRVFHTDVTGMLRDFYKRWRKTVNVFMLDRFMYLSSHLYMYLESFLLFYLFILRGGGWG